MIFGHLDPKLTKSDGTDDVESDVKWQNSNQDKEDGVETQFPVKESRTEENTRNSHVPGWESAKKTTKKQGKLSKCGKLHLGRWSWGYIPSQPGDTHPTAS